MKRCLAVILLSVLLCGCSSGPGNSMSGYVIAKDSKSILVVNPSPEDEKTIDAAWVTNADADLGEQVEILFEGNDFPASYPTMGKAKKVKIQKDEQPKGSRLSKSEAVRKAIEEVSSEQDSILVVKAAEFNENTALWKIVINDQQISIHAKE
jgi:hypothetical protein